MLEGFGRGGGGGGGVCTSKGNVVVGTALWLPIVTCAKNDHAITVW